MKDTLKSVGRRIREARGHLSQELSAKQLGITPNHLSKVERSAAPPSRKLLQAISDAFNINIGWLLYGEGPKERQAQSQPGAVAETAPEVTVSGDAYIIRIPRRRKHRVTLSPQVHESPVVSIPFMASPVGAGTPTAMDDKIKTRIVWPLAGLPSRSRKHKLAALILKGESMAPTMPEGSICIVDLSQTEPGLLRRKLVVAKIEEECLIKRLVIQARKMLLTSINPDFAPIPVGPDVQILGRVILVFWSPD